MGHATPDSVRLWLRTGRTGQFTLLLSRRDTTLDADARAALRDQLGRVPLSLEDAEALATGTRRLDFAIENF